MQQVRQAIEAVDALLKSDLDAEDLLLDMRLHLMRKEEPSVCVSHYFRLKRRLSGWHARKLEALKGALESGIAIEIVAADERRRRCLGLGEQLHLEEYCKEQMKRSALEHKEVSRIQMRFCWA